MTKDMRPTWGAPSMEWLAACRRPSADSAAAADNEAPWWFIDEDPDEPGTCDSCGGCTHGFDNCFAIAAADAVRFLEGRLGPCCLGQGGWPPQVKDALREAIAAALKVNEVGMENGGMVRPPRPI